MSFAALTRGGLLATSTVASKLKLRRLAGLTAKAHSSMTANSTTLAVCLSLIRVHDPHRSTDRTVQLLRRNFPGVTPAWIDHVDHDIHILAPDWMAWLQREQARGKSTGSILWVLEYMKAGGFSRRPLPQYSLCMEGLAATLRDLIILGRRWAVGQRLTLRRSFERNREGDAFGYLTNREHPWYDHPGNTGWY